MTDIRAVIDPEKCDRSSLCPAKRVCPAQAIEREEEDEAYFVNSYCQGCGKCIIYCPKKAIKLI